MRNAIGSIYVKVYLIHVRLSRFKVDPSVIQKNRNTTDNNINKSNHHIHKQNVYYREFNTTSERYLKFFIVCLL